MRRERKPKEKEEGKRKWNDRNKESSKRVEDMG